MLPIQYIEKLQLILKEQNEEHGLNIEKEFQVLDPCCETKCTEY